MSESRRVLDGYTVRRDDETGEILLDAEWGDWRLSVDDLRSLLAYAETGEEPPLTQEEQQQAEKGRQFAAFLDSLLND